QRLRDAHLHLCRRRHPESARRLGQGHRIPRAAIASGGLLDQRTRRAQQIRPHLGLQGPQRARPGTRGIPAARQRLAGAKRRAAGPAGEQAVGSGVLLAGSVAGRGHAGQGGFRQRRLAWAWAFSRSGMLLAEAASPRREPRVTASAATAASFSMTLAMIASLARSKTPRSVATKRCDSRSPAR